MQLINIITSPRHGKRRFLLGQFLCRDGANPNLIWVRDRDGKRTYLGTPLGPATDSTKPVQPCLLDGMTFEEG